MTVVSGGCSRWVAGGLRWAARCTEVDSIVDRDRRRYELTWVVESGTCLHLRASMSLPGVSRQRRIRSVCWRTTVKASSSSRAWSSTSGGDAILKQGGLVWCEGRRNCFYSARMTMVWTAMAWPIDRHLRVAASRRSAHHYQTARAPTRGPSSTAVSLRLQPPQSLP